MGRETQPCPSEPAARITKRRCPSHVEDEGVACSGKACQACTARVIADCIAVCCCPCAVVNLFTLAFFKVPWMMGRRCLGNLSKKKKKRKRLQDEGRMGNLGKDEGENGDFGKVISIDEDEDEEEDEGGSSKYSARFEAERVWLELYRVDNLGFGRVSFNGIQSLG